MPLTPSTDPNANTPARPRKLLSLRTELLTTIAILAATALLIAAGSAVIFSGLASSEMSALWLTLLIVGDVAVFVLLLAHQLERLVASPLARVLEATGAIAAGDLSRRVPDAATEELTMLAASVNRMTDHLLAEQAQRIRAEKLAGIGRLAAGIAHEIGNPLGAINGYTHLLRARVGGDARGLEALDGVERESTRIDRIVRGLLDYARPRRSTPAGRIDVNATIGAATQLLTDQGALRGIQLAISLDREVPLLAGDRHQLEQMLVNLLLNATDAMEGSGTIAIISHRVSRSRLEQSVQRRTDDPPNALVPRRPTPRVRHWLESTEPAEEILKLVVADSGPGIPEEDAERVFDPFYTTKDPGKGTGLGLAIVARVVDDLGGTIWVQRSREGGAAFHALFPLVTVARPATDKTIQLGNFPTSVRTRGTGSR